MLTTNMIRKDLNSQNTHDAGVALSSLACFMSPDLARDLTGDILTLLTSTKPYIRKKAVLILYKVSIYGSIRGLKRVKRCKKRGSKGSKQVQICPKVVFLSPLESVGTVKFIRVYLSPAEPKF